MRCIVVFAHEHIIYFFILYSTLTLSQWCS